MPRTVCIVTAIISILIVQIAEASVVTIGGKMVTSASCVDQFVLHVPTSCILFDVQVPLPQSACSSTSLSGSQGPVVTTTESIAPNSIYNRNDQFGNSYRILEYRNLNTCDLTLSINFDNLQIASNLARPEHSSQLPINHLSNDIQRYLWSTDMVQCRNCKLMRLASSITHNTPTETAAARAIADWMRQHIVYKLRQVGESNDALSVLNRHSAQCAGWANLFLALARSAGIPARYVGGYQLAGSIVYPLSDDGFSKLTSASASSPHAWVELYIVGQGWVAYEPQQTAEFVDSHHVKIWTGLDSQSNMPLFVWRSDVNSTAPLTFSESVATTRIEDTQDLYYVAGSEVASEPTLICPADPLPAGSVKTARN